MTSILPAIFPSGRNGAFALFNILLTHIKLMISPICLLSTIEKYPAVSWKYATSSNYSRYGELNLFKPQDIRFRSFFSIKRKQVHRKYRNFSCQNNVDRILEMSFLSTTTLNQKFSFCFHTFFAYDLDL